MGEADGPNAAECGGDHRAPRARAALSLARQQAPRARDHQRCRGGRARHRRAGRSARALRGPARPAAPGSQAAAAPPGVRRPHRERRPARSRTTPSGGATVGSSPPPSRRRPSTLSQPRAAAREAAETVDPEGRSTCSCRCAPAPPTGGSAATSPGGGLSGEPARRITPKPPDPRVLHAPHLLDRFLTFLTLLEHPYLPGAPGGAGRRLRRALQPCPRPREPAQPRPGRCAPRPRRGHLAERARIKRHTPATRRLHPHARAAQPQPWIDQTLHP